MIKLILIQLISIVALLLTTLNGGPYHYEVYCRMKKIVFLTGTRADFGKLKSLIAVIASSGIFDVHIFATGMHMNPRYGRTVDEIGNSGYKNILCIIIILTMMIWISFWQKLLMVFRTL
jgi:hypothetical protein